MEKVTPFLSHFIIPVTLCNDVIIIALCNKIAVSLCNKLSLGNSFAIKLVGKLRELLSPNLCVFFLNPLTMTFLLYLTTKFGF